MAKEQAPAATEAVPARVTVWLDRKYNPAQYQSLDVHVGLSDDVQTGETRQQALDRVTRVTLAQFEELCNKFEGEPTTKKGGSR